MEFRHVDEVLDLVPKGVNPPKSAVLPHGWTVSLERGELRFAMAVPKLESLDYEFRLPLPGAVEVPATGSRFEALVVSGNRGGVYNPEHLLDRTRLDQELRVRNWRLGDRFWPGHTKAPKKVKELLQERHLSGSDRKLWPVVVSGADVIWMRGFAVPSQFQARAEGREAVVIRETPLR